MLTSGVCTSTQLKSPQLQQWMEKLGHPPMMMHRKVWEWAYIAQALHERGMLAPGRRGLGFAVGKEPLVALFASMGCEIVATDLDEDTAAAVGWTATNQHASDVNALNELGLCDPITFSRQVSFRVVNMNHVPEDLSGFDFIWSSCSIEHLGDIHAAEEFLSRSMNCLRPGGIAVHTTEYNLTSDTDTIDRGVTVILRKSDIESMATRLRNEGHEVSPVDFEIGDAEDDQVILQPPYKGPVCLKIWIGTFAATSIGLIATAGINAGKTQSRPIRHAAPSAERIIESAAFLPRLRNWLAPSHTKSVSTPAEPVSSTAAATIGPLDLDDVVAAYRLLLNRAPDPSGLENYRRLIASGAMTSRRDLVENMSGSAEFQASSRGGSAPMHVELQGYSMFVRGNDHDIGATILRTKAYEPHVTAVVREFLRKDDVFVDIGANVGFFMALAASIVGPRGLVVAVEPMDKNLQLLYATVWHNEFGHVQIQPFAASDKIALLPMATGPGTSNGQVVVNGGSGKLPTLFAQSRRMDDLLSHIPKLDLLKIDIEGHELMALRGFTDGLARHRPRLVTEFHPKCMRENSGVDPREYLQFLFDYSSHVVVLHSDGSRVPCAAADEVTREWQSADTRLASNGTTHIDLFLNPHA